jgi:hypothetical protein
MGYKIFGFVVWQGVRLYLRRRLNGGSRKLAVAGVAGALLVGAAVTAQRSRSD